MKKENIILAIVTCICTLGIVILIAIGFQIFKNKTTTTSIETQQRVEEQEYEEIDPGNTDLDLVILDGLSIEELLSVIMDDAVKIEDSSSRIEELANEDIVGNVNEIRQMVIDDLIRVERMEYYGTAIYYSPLFELVDSNGDMRYEEMYDVIIELFDLTDQYRYIGKLVFDMTDAIKLYGALPEEWKETFEELITSRNLNE